MVAINGFLGIDKPADHTSQDVVAWVRKRFGIEKVGHTGTLDPMATGVLILCLGAYTRFSSHVTGRDKQYRAVVHLGITTDSLDADGAVVGQAEDIPTDRAKVEAAVATFRGKIAQVPPMYSAIRMRGRRLYELARKGVEVEREARLYTFTNSTSRHFIHRSCTSMSIAQRARTFGHSQTILATAWVAARTCPSFVEPRWAMSRSGNAPRFAISTAQVRLSDVLLDPHVVLSDLSSVCLSAAQQVRFSHGNPVVGVETDLRGLVTVQNSRGTLLGLGQLDEGVLKPIRVLQNR